eukprot:gene29770-5373_t
MAPEVIEHKPYDTKADVFSFGIVMWELLTGQVPHGDMTPLQAAVGVVQQGLRPALPSDCPPSFAAVMAKCWAQSPTARPTFKEITPMLLSLLEEAKAAAEQRTADAALAAAQSHKNSKSLLSKLAKRVPSLKTS